MQELVYCLSYVLEHVLEHMDLMRNWVDIEVEIASVAMCNLCGDDCESVDHFLWNCPTYLQHCALCLKN